MTQEHKHSSHRTTKHVEQHSSYSLSLLTDPSSHLTYSSYYGITADCLFDKQEPQPREVNSVWELFPSADCREAPRIAHPRPSVGLGWPVHACPAVLCSLCIDCIFSLAYPISFVKHLDWLRYNTDQLDRTCFDECWLGVGYDDDIDVLLATNAGVKYPCCSKVTLICVIFTHL